MSYTIEKVSKTMHKSWAKLLIDQFHTKYMRKLSKFVQQERSNHNVHPKRKDVFKVLKLSYDKVKIVVLGQDPYHTPKTADGLAFSSKYCNNIGRRTPPSLVNIFKEAEKSTGFNINFIDTDLTRWWKQGVFLMNTILTVREGDPKSHRLKGWERFTSRIIEVLNDREDPIIFMLWGNNAKSYSSKIYNDHHYILKAPHPSPFSYHLGFKDCNHFEDANIILKELDKKPIDWR